MSCNCRRTKAYKEKKKTDTLYAKDQYLNTGKNRDQYPKVKTQHKHNWVNFPLKPKIYI